MWWSVGYTVCAAPTTGFPTRGRKYDLYACRGDQWSPALYCFRQVYTSLRHHRYAKRQSLFDWEEKVIDQACIILRQALCPVATGTGSIVIEKILIDGQGQDKIRLAHKENNSPSLSHRSAKPLELVEDDFYELIKQGLERQVISQVLQAGLKTVIRGVDAPSLATKPYRSSPYCEVYARGELCNANDIICMERIFFPGLNLYCIRLAMGKKNEQGLRSIQLSPPCMGEEEFLYLFKHALENGVFSKVFINALLALL